MNCKEYQEFLPSFIKKELEGEKRILTKNHLKSCPDCRKEYLSQVKISYIIDREEILVPVSKISAAFNQEVLDRISLSAEKKQIKSRWIWYAAAAILLIGIIIGRFGIPEIGSQRNSGNIADESLSQLIVSENWQKLEIVLSNQEEFNRYSTDTIPVYVLIDKLSALQKTGIYSLPFTYILDRLNAKELTTNRSDPQIHIPLSDFIQLLEQVKHQRSQITLEEVSNLLTKL